MISLCLIAFLNHLWSNAWTAKFLFLWIGWSNFLRRSFASLLKPFILALFISYYPVLIFEIISSSLSPSNGSIPARRRYISTPIDQMSLLSSSSSSPVTTSGALYCKFLILEFNLKSSAFDSVEVMTSVILIALVLLSESN